MTAFLSVMFLVNFFGAIAAYYMLITANFAPGDTRGGVAFRFLVNAAVAIWAGALLFSPHATGG